MSVAVAFDPIEGLAEGDFHFEQDSHAYLEGGVRRMSLTQAIGIVGLVDYSMVPPQILEAARWRGTMVHQAAAEIDRGVDVWGQYDVPEACVPYVEAYDLFMRETGFMPDQNEIEQPRIVTIAGLRLGMTPDVVGLLFGEHAVVERKTCSARHPAWALQLAGQEMGLKRPPRQRRYRRYSLQLMRTGKYRLDAHDDESDFDLCCDMLRVAAWKLKHRLATLP